MIIRVLFEALTLNAGFFISLVMENLFITFGLFAAFKIITGKKVWPHFFFLVGALYALHSFMQLNHLTFFPRAELIYFFCFVVAPIWIFTEGTRFEHKRKLIIMSCVIALSWGITGGA